MPSVRAHDEQRLRRRTGVLEPDRDEVVALVRGAPAGPRELAFLEVAERVRRVQPVLAQERRAALAVGGLAGDGRGAPADDDGRHQPAGAAIAAKPGVSARRCCSTCDRPRRSDCLVRGAQDTLVGDDAGDQLGRRHVERRVADVRVGRRDAHAAERQDLVRRPLLDRDGGAGRGSARSTELIGAAT